MATREKIFEFDATQDIDNLRKLREEIKDLKKVMEELEIGSREYAETSDRLFAKQSRLAELMKEHKKPIENVADSFNGLNERLKTLKDRWKATGDEMERAALTKEINRVKEGINDMNESIGNYQHNVGNYTNSIVAAFDQMGISVGKPVTKMASLFGFLTGGLGQAVQAFQKLWVVIAANPVGALIAALGTLLVFWDDIKEAIGSVKTEQEKLTEATQDYIDALKDGQTEMDRTIKLMRSMGYSEAEIAAYRVRTLNEQLEATNGKLEEQEAELDRLNKWWMRVSRTILSIVKYIAPVPEETMEFFGGNGKVDALKDSIAKLKDETKDLGKAVDDAHLDEWIALNEQDKKATEATTKARTKATESFREEAEALRELQTEIDKAVADQQRPVEEYEEGLKKAMEMLENLQKEQLSPLEQEQMEYEERLKLFEQYGLDTELLEEEHQERMAEIREETAKKVNAQIAQQAAEKKKKDDEAEANYQKLMKARETATKNMASGTTSILNAAAKAVGENTKLGKGFAIAAATIDTIASAVAGFRAGMNQWADAGPMAWMAPVQAALNATMALTAGFAEVQKIRSVDTSGNSNAGGGMATAMAMPNIEGLSTPMDYTRQVVTDTEREEMNQDSRVYILESDIQQSNNRVRVREEETTF